MPTQRLEFRGSQGDSLTARLDSPGDTEPLAYALFAHCFTCGKNLKPIVNINRALLIFHSPLDNTVGIENAAKLFQAAKHPKSFISLDNADHLLTDERDSEYVGAMATTWASRYL